MHLLFYFVTQLHVCLCVRLDCVCDCWALRSLLERLVGARLVYQQACMTRVISFEYLNRQLVWQELSEFLLFMLPLVNSLKLGQWLRPYLPRLPNPAVVLAALGATAPAPMATAAGSGSSTGSGTAQVPGSSTATTTGSGAAATSSQEGQQKALEGSAGPCPCCGSQDLLLPYVALPCRHVFCYYCLSSQCAADQVYACPLDGVRVRAMRRGGHALQGEAG